MSRFVLGVEEPLGLFLVLGVQALLLSRFDVLDVERAPRPFEKSVPLIHFHLHWLQRESPAKEKVSELWKAVKEQSEHVAELPFY